MSNFPCSPTRNITSHSKENLAFHSLLRWKKITIQILATSLMHFLFKRLGECTFLHNMFWEEYFTCPWLLWVQDKATQDSYSFGCWTTIRTRYTGYTNKSGWGSNIFTARKTNTQNKEWTGFGYSLNAFMLTWTRSDADAQTGQKSLG